MIVDRFRDRYAFLSNFSPVGGALPTVEHQYQASKATEVDDAIYVMSAPLAKDAKRRGQTITMRADWEDVKIDIMHKILVRKFSDQRARDLLLDTGDAELIEGNTWGDTFWGMCNGEGENILGQLLMGIRESLQELT